MSTLQEIESRRIALGRRLAAMRKAAGLTQSQLAALVSYDRSTVANVEVGRQHAVEVFWQGCDRVLCAQGLLIQESRELTALIESSKRTASELAQAQRRAQWLPEQPAVSCGRPHFATVLGSFHAKGMAHISVVDEAVSLVASPQVTPAIVNALEAMIADV